MTLTEAFATHDMDDLIDRMTIYADDHLKCFGIKDLQGIQAVDIVQEVLLKVSEGDRDWGKAKCTFPEFLFGCLKSHLSAFQKKIKPRFANEIPDKASHNGSDPDALRNFAIERLKAQGADENELLIFDCFTDGINKPSDLLSELNLDINTINNAIKRLRRKLTNLGQIVKKIL